MWDIWLSVVCCGWASLGSESRPSSSELLFQGDGYIPRWSCLHSCSLLPSVPKCHGFGGSLFLLAIRGTVLGPPSSLSEDHSGDCYLDPAVTHFAVGISRWKDTITGWGSNLLWKAGDSCSGNREGFCHSYGEGALPHSSGKDTFVLRLLPWSPSLTRKSVPACEQLLSN